jgi:elongator complex protein 1
MQDEIERLVEGLIKRGMRERADAVSTAVSEVLERCAYAVKEIYPPAANAVGAASTTEGDLGATNVGVEGEALKPTGADATLWDSLQEVGKRREPPVIKPFARLSLLG